MTRRAIAGVLLAAGCGVFAGGRYRDTLQKLRKDKRLPAGTTKCQTESPEAKCQISFPDRDVSDLIGLARDVGGLDPRRAGPHAEDRVYYEMLLANPSYVDLARHGPDGLYPGVPFLFDIAGRIDPSRQRIEKAKLVIKTVEENQVGGVSWWLGRMHRGVTEATPGDDPKKTDPSEAPVLADATFGKEPSLMFEGLKYLGFRCKTFDSKGYLEYLIGGFLDSKIEEAKKEKDGYSFDVTAALNRAIEDQLPSLLVFLAPNVTKSGKDGDPTYLFVATRAAPEPLRPALVIEYREAAPPPEPVGPKKKRKK